MAEKRKRENILDVQKFIGKKVHVKFIGGREVEGILQGSDALVNLVIDEAQEFIRDLEDPLQLTNKTRSLGLVVCRGTTIVSIFPADGFESIENPFVEQET